MPLYTLDVETGAGRSQHYNNFAINDAAARADAVEVVAEFACDAQRLTDDGAIVVQVTNAGREVAAVKLVCSIE